MKAIFILVVAIFSSMLFCTRATAQIHNIKQRFLELGGGVIDGSLGQRADNAGSYFSMTYGRFGKKEGVWRGSFVAQRKFYTLPRPLAVNTPDQRPLTPVWQYLVVGSYSPSILRSTARSWYLMPLIGGLAGYELADDRRLGLSGDDKKSRFLIGFVAGLSGEINFNERYSIVGYTKAHYTGSSRIQPFHLLMGLTFRINYFVQ